MESTPIEKASELDAATQAAEAEQKAVSSEKCTLPEDNKTEVSQNQEENENDDETFFDAQDEEEAKVQAEQVSPKLDEIASVNTTNLVKLDLKSSDGPEEKVLINQITDYTDFKVIDKLDKDTYITDEFRNYAPSEQDVFILVKKSGICQRLIWGEPVKLKDKENQRW